MHPDQRATFRSMEVPPEILEKHLGKEITDILTTLRPALLAYDVTKDDTKFFLDHREDLLPIRAFIVQGSNRSNPEQSLSPLTQRYLHELRTDLIAIFQSNALQRGFASHFAISNHPQPCHSINPCRWHPNTLAFIEQHIRPVLGHIIKAQHIDTWLQTPLDILGGLSPIQAIQFGEGEQVKSMVEEMRYK